eukprot:CAMPEP_0176484924 /NCGR_PEP_ID=MMETSP0200_2-20121128/4757_1 /TAXON_ID=947934 /ORGANISM="Chaetoceros sp., Strain GSL56" /LENGTH=380 /DNA_ID=CAMNT_0017881517 /DNA_START=106 /DNA_END=1249 /DNA_ORIENTATION=-
MSVQSADVPLGMMDGAYFTSRKEILDFFNGLLQMNLTKIEQTASGAVACQLMDYMFPGSIPMKRVNWEAKSDFQFIENYKILQAAFTKQRVQKRIDVDRLIRAKYQDNLEFCQWLKAFFEHASSWSREDYDPVARRMLGKGGKKLDEMFLPRSINKNLLPSSSSTASIKPRSVRPSSGASVASVRSTSSRSKSAAVRPSTFQPLRENNVKKSVNTSGGKEAEKLVTQNDELNQKNSQLRRKLAETELILENVEKERGMKRLKDFQTSPMKLHAFLTPQIHHLFVDFYFEKLRGIEVFLQVYEEKKEEKDVEPLVQNIFKVLYAKIEDDIVVTDDGELLEGMAQGQDDLLNDSAVSMLSDDPVDRVDENCPAEQLQITGSF